MRSILLGTRRSALAKAQAQWVADELSRRLAREVELVEITSDGDVLQGPLSEVGGQGVFVTALRQALLDGRIDAAVHSYKDVPTGLAAGLVAAAVPTREDPSDVLVTNEDQTLADLQAGATVATGSLRRAAAIRAARPDLEIVEIRGNVDTRLGRLADGDVDALVLARAGLARLGKLAAVSEVFTPEVLMPAPAQGALLIECAEDSDVASDIEVLDDARARVCVDAERALLADLEAGCSAPVGALATIAETHSSLGPEAQITLQGAVYAVDGSRTVRLSTTGSITEPIALAHALARELRAAGATALLGERIS
jgi:hydroxymethylbilane synthase